MILTASRYYEPLLRLDESESTREDTRRLHEDYLRLPSRLIRRPPLGVQSESSHRVRGGTDKMCLARASSAWHILCSSPLSHTLVAVRCWENALRLGKGRAWQGADTSPHRRGQPGWKGNPHALAMGWYACAPICSSILASPRRVKGQISGASEAGSAMLQQYALTAGDSSSRALPKLKRRSTWSSRHPSKSS